MDFNRSAGILLHLTSLPGNFGIGDLGKEAYQFVDFLKAAGQKLWQMLPVNPTGYGNSPYQCVSVFAGNPLLISPEKLRDMNLISDDDLTITSIFPDHFVDFDSVSAYKIKLLGKAYTVFRNSPDSTLKERYQRFCDKNADWLDDYALFSAYKDSHQQTAWNTWPEDIRGRDGSAINYWTEHLEFEIGSYKFQQYIFYEQWTEFKAYCNSCGISLIGDIPIFVSLDSDTVWGHPEYFQLNPDGTPRVVAGVPPDYFSSSGQLWGNPLYNWEVIRNDGYKWWINRFRMVFSLFDIVRIDHFRGFESYWEIPGNASSAISGRWIKGPGTELFQTVQQSLGDLRIIAEDLGIITPEVEIVLDKLGFPGMKVLQFAFGDDNNKINKYLPHNYIRNSVVYTGTHDNNTTIGWFKDDSSTTLSTEDRNKERQRALEYLGTDGSNINWDLIRLAYMSIANTAIIPMQDILGLGTESRMNIPGSVQNNWRWRFSADMITYQIRLRLHRMSIVYGR
jgi:4-alpha-glucanotransferase